MISNEVKDGWHYLAVKKLSALLRRLPSKHDTDFYCFSCFHFLEQKINLNLIKKYAKIKDLLNCNAIRKEYYIRI